MHAYMRVRLGLWGGEASKGKLLTASLGSGQYVATSSQPKGRSELALMCERVRVRVHYYRTMEMHLTGQKTCKVVDKLLHVLSCIPNI